MRTDPPPSNRKTRSVLRDQLQQISVLQRGFLVRADTYIAGGGRRPLHPDESRVTVCEHARPVKTTFRFRMTASSKRREVCTLSRALKLVATPCTLFSSHEKPSVDLNDPIGRWQPRHCSGKRRKSCASNCLRWCRGTGRPHRQLLN